MCFFRCKNALSVCRRCIFGCKKGSRNWSFVAPELTVLYVCPSVFTKTMNMDFEPKIIRTRVLIEDFRGFRPNRPILPNSGTGSEALAICLWLKTGRNRREISPIRRFRDEISPKITQLRKDRRLRAPQPSKKPRKFTSFAKTKG